jgi:hypothetical protein
MATNIFPLQVEQNCSNWCFAELATIAHNLAFVRRQPQPSQHLVTPVVYHNIATILNGNSSRRNLTVQKNQYLPPLIFLLHEFLFPKQWMNRMALGGSISWLSALLLLFCCYIIAQ